MQFKLINTRMSKKYTHTYILYVYINIYFYLSIYCVYISTRNTIMYIYIFFYGRVVRRTD